MAVVIAIERLPDAVSVWCSSLVLDSDSWDSSNRTENYLRMRESSKIKSRTFRTTAAAAVVI